MPDPGLQLSLVDFATAVEDPPDLRSTEDSAVPALLTAREVAAVLRVPRPAVALDTEDVTADRLLVSRLVPAQRLAGTDSGHDGSAEPRR